MLKGGESSDMLEKTTDRGRIEASVTGMHREQEGGHSNPQPRHSSRMPSGIMDTVCKLLQQRMVEGWPRQRGCVV